LRIKTKEENDLEFVINPLLEIMTNTSVDYNKFIETLSSSLSDSAAAEEMILAGGGDSDTCLSFKSWVSLYQSRKNKIQS
jgi:uncharacterized protein YdiU (UPF0061 family)